MMIPQGFSPSFPMQAYPGPRPGPQFLPDPGQGIGPAQPSRNWNPQVAQQQLPPRRIARAQVEDEPPPSPARAASRSVALTIPSPEELGVPQTKTSEAGAIDWTAVHNQLNQLGATCFHLERSEGGFRISCLLPTAQAGRTRRIEAEAASEAAAVQATLAKAEEWAAGR